MPKTPEVRIAVGARLLSRGTKADKEYPDPTRPLSLTMGPQVTWLYVTDDAEAKAIVESWRPTFKVTVCADTSEW